jgi:hypothetical protein
LYMKTTKTIKPPMVQTSFKVEETLMDKLKQKAIEEDTSVSRLFRRGAKLILQEEVNTETQIQEVLEQVKGLLDTLPKKGKK